MTIGIKPDGETYGEEARRLHPEYEDPNADCDVPSCINKVAGSRTMTWRNPEDRQYLPILIRLCLGHMLTPRERLVTLLPPISQIEEYPG